MTALADRNARSLADWQRKWRCLQSVREIEPQCDGYDDLRDADQQWRGQKLRAYRLTARLILKGLRLRR